MHIAHCNQLRNYSIGMVDELSDEFWWCVAHETPLFQYWNYVTDCSVQSTVMAINCETTITSTYMYMYVLL